MEHSSFLPEFLVLISSAVVVSAMFRRIKAPTILAYILVGIVMGPGALGWVSHLETIHILAEFGVVFLLFSLGLEFSLAKMIALRNVVFGLGGAQVLISSTVIYLAAYFLFDTSQEEAVIIAGALALSSTAVVSKELVVRNEIGSLQGIYSIGILLFQDIAAVLFLILVPFLSGNTEQSLGISLAITLVKGGALLVVMLGLGKWVLPFLFDEIAKAKSEELFVLTVLMVSLVAAVSAHSLGLGMALGAFLAGMMLSETHYKHQVEAEIRPFRDVLLGLFFMSVGLNVDLKIVIANGFGILLLTIAIIGLKALLTGALAYKFRKNRSVAIKTGLYLAQGGEFGFALFALGGVNGLLSPEVAAIMVTAVSLSISLTPYLMTFAGTLARRLTPQQVELPLSRAESLDHASANLEKHAIICGFGRVGQTIARFLHQAELPSIAIDYDPVRVSEASRAGESVYYGDSEKLHVLKALGLERASLVVITYNDVAKASKVIHLIRGENTEVPILVRTADDSDLDLLLLAGATEIVPETLEASLMLVSQVLMLMGKPMRYITRTIEESRRSRYKLLHGYYPGINSQIMTDDGERLEKLHAVTLLEHAYGCNKALASLPLAGCRIDAIKRNGEEIKDPSPDIEMMPGDTIILRGSAEQVEQAENRLLGG